MTPREVLYCSNCGARIIEGKTRRNDLHRCDAGRPARCGVWQPKLDLSAAGWPARTKYRTEAEVLITQ